MSHYESNTRHAYSKTSLEIYHRFELLKLDKTPVAAFSGKKKSPKPDDPVVAMKSLKYNTQLSPAAAMLQPLPGSWKTQKQMITEAEIYISSKVEN